MSKRVFRDKQITDYDSDDPYSAFRRPKKRKKIRKDQNKEKNEHPRQIVEDDNRDLNWKECFWSKKYSNSQLKPIPKRSQQLVEFICRENLKSEAGKLSAAKLQSLFDTTTDRIEKLKESYGNDFDKKISLQKYRAIRNALRRHIIELEDRAFTPEEAKRWLAKIPSASFFSTFLPC
jgi:hypothetical protein